MSRKRVVYGAVLIVLSTFVVGGCRRMKAEPKTLGDLAYDVNEKLGYTLYIKEDSIYVPYLVLTSDYNGQVLLVREELLDEKHVINEDAYGYAGYYKDSSIDMFLNGEYLTRLQTEVRDAIVDSEVEITTKESIGSAGEKTENIIRKVFLLSYTELGFTHYGAVNKEGKPLKYFESPENRIAYKDNLATSWWLRTAEICWFNVVCGINEEGGCGTAAVNREHGVRPAFCLSNAVEVKLSADLIDGKKVYVISE